MSKKKCLFTFFPYPGIRVKYGYVVPNPRHCLKSELVVMLIYSIMAFLLFRVTTLQKWSLSPYLEQPKNQCLKPDQCVSRSRSWLDFVVTKSRKGDFLYEFYTLCTWDFRQWFGTGNRNFFLSGTGTVMHSGFRIGFGPGSNIKYNTKVKKIKNLRQLSGEKMMLLALKRQDFVQIFCCWSTCYINITCDTHL